MAYIYDLTDTWNAGGTTFNAIKMNVTDSASASASKLVTLQTNGTERFSVTKGGQGYFSGNVGIGTTSPPLKFVVSNAGAAGLEIDPTAVASAPVIQSYNRSGAAYTQLTYSALQHVWQISGTEQMRIDSSGNVGIGITPTARLHVAGTIQSSSGSTTAQMFADGSAAYFTSVGAFPSIFSTNGTERMRIDSSGNVGVNCTPSPWVSSWRAIDITTGGGALFGSLAISGIANNAYLDSGVDWRYKSSFGAAQIYMGSNGATTFYNAAAGTAGNVISFVESMRIDASGNVGIGTATPSYKLETRTDAVSGFNWVASFNNTATGGFGAGFLARSSVGSAYFYMRGDGVAYVENSTNNALGFATNATERARIDGAGNVGIGTTTPQAKVEVNGGLDGVYNANVLVTSTANTAKLAFNPTGVSSSGVGNVGGGLVFYASGANTERARIDASGNLMVGKSTMADTTVGVSVVGNTSSSQYGAITSTLAASTNANQTLQVYSTGASAYRFYVDMAGTVFATSTTISAISDIRFKENVRELDAGLDTILALKPRRFDWKQGKGKDVRDDMGFIAQEVEEVLPELIGGWKAGEGEPDDLKSVKAGDLIPVLVKAIQELTARVAQLEGN
jgi:hypothetical protein